LSVSAGFSASGFCVSVPAASCTSGLAMKITARTPVVTGGDPGRSSARQLFFATERTMASTELGPVG
jgi:hypothetical protein